MGGMERGTSMSRRTAIAVGGGIGGMAAAIWHNWTINAPVMRSLIAYGD